MGCKTLRLRISGRVQGVGFRAFVADEAERRGLFGWVRNRGDGSVEAIISGKDEIVDKMVEICRRGPHGSRVANLEVESANESEVKRSGFDILRTI